MISVKEKAIQFACPVCRGALTAVAKDALHCPVDDLTFSCEAGIWHFLPPNRQAVYDRFLHEYETIRRSEGRGSFDPAYYRALPFPNSPSPPVAGWPERAQSFRTLQEKVLGRRHRLQVLDLGAGNCWLSNQLAKRGHLATAVDIILNEWDGLGAHRYYETQFRPIQAEFDHLPLAEKQIDIAIFNASFHYSTAYERTLQEVRRLLLPEGQVVVMDTAVYEAADSGRLMIAAREADFCQRYGFAANALPSENFLTYTRLDELAADLRMTWQIIWPVPAWRRWLRRLKVAWRSQREPGQFPLLIGRFQP